MASSALLAASTTTATTSTNPDLIKNPNTINLNNSPQSLNQPMSGGGGGVRRRTVEDVWKGIVEGGREKEKEKERKVCKVEVPDDMMTLEDFLVMAGAVDKEEIVAHVEEEEEEEDVKVMRIPLSGSVSASVGMMSSNNRLFSFDSVPLSPFPSSRGSMYGSGMLLRLGSDVGNDGGGEIGREKRRGSGAFENLDKAAQKRQRRMIKNRESAARSRERKQEHQVKLESLASKLEEENAQLLKQKAAQTKERLKLLMEQIIPVVEQRKPPRPLRRVNSWEW